MGYGTDTLKNSIIANYLSANNHQLIASKTSVDGSVLASTNLDWVSGISLATHFPSFIVVKYRSGVTGICVARVKADTVIIVPTASLLTLVSGSYMASPIIMTGLTLLPADASKFLILDVTTASLAASLIDVYIYGIKI